MPEISALFDNNRTVENALSEQTFTLSDKLLSATTLHRTADLANQLAASHSVAATNLAKYHPSLNRANELISGLRANLSLSAEQVVKHHTKRASDIVSGINSNLADQIFKTNLNRASDPFEHQRAAMLPLSDFLHRDK